MQAVIPYTYVNPVVKACIQQECKESGCPYIFVEMTREDSYWRLMCDLWEQAKPVTIIEHDIIPWPGSLKELESCPMDWCSLTYRMSSSSTGQTGYGVSAFGCTRFRPRLMEKLPEVWTSLDSTSWKHLDAQFCRIAQLQGFLPHPHRPPVTHLHGLV